VPVNLEGDSSETDSDDSGVGTADEDDIDAIDDKLHDGLLPATPEAWGSPTFAPPGLKPAVPPSESAPTTTAAAPAAVAAADGAAAVAPASADGAAAPSAAAAAPAKKLNKFRRAGKLIGAAAAFRTPAQRAADEVAALRREVLAAGGLHSSASRLDLSRFVE